MGYREGAWFKNNFAKVFSACNYYAGVATTMSFRSLGSMSVLKDSVRWCVTLVQGYSRYVCSSNFTAGFSKLCASLRPVFLVYSPHKYCRGTDKSFFGIIILVVERIRKVYRSYFQNLTIHFQPVMCAAPRVHVASIYLLTLSLVHNMMLMPQASWASWASQKKQFFH